MRLPFFSHNHYSPISLEFKDRQIVAAQFRASGEDMVLHATARVPTPATALRIDGAATIRKLMHAAPFRGRRVITSLPRLQIDIRPVLMPAKTDPAKPREYRQALAKVASDILPQGLSETVVDSLPIGVAEINGKKCFRAVLITAARKHVDAHLHAITEAGLQCIGLDAAPCAAARLMGGSLTDIVAMLELDYESSILFIIADHGLVFSRTLRWGIDNWTAALEESLAISRHEALGLLARYGFTAPANSLARSTGATLPSAEKMSTIVGEICCAGLDQLMTQVEQSIAYFIGNNFDYTVSRLLLYGHLLPSGLDAALNNALQMPVERAKWPNRKLLPDTMAEPDAIYINAAGLALRKVME